MAKDRDQKSFSDALVEAAVDAIITIDTGGVVQTFNPAAEHIFGYEADEVIGKNVNLLMPEPYESEHDDYMKHYLDTNEARIIGIGREAVGKRADGSTFPIHLAVNEFTIDGKRNFVGILQDITELERDKGRLLAQYKTTRALAASSTIDEAASKFAQSICEEMGWALGCVWAVDSEQNVLRWMGGWHESVDLNEFSKETGAMTFKRDEGIPGRAWSSGKLIWVEDVACEPGQLRKRLAERLGVHGALFFPFESEGEGMGVIEFDSKTTEEPDEDLIRVVETMGIQLCEFMKRRKAEGEADRAKDEFFALVSHELRTPLTSIAGYLELLEEDSNGESVLPAEQRKFLSVIKRNTRRLQRLVSDMLFVAQVQAGKLPLEHETVDLGSVIAHSVEEAQPRASEAGINLESEIEPVPSIEGDADRLGQVLDNLILNAIKVTPSGGHVRVKMSKQDGIALIAVQDTGPGIPEEEQERLFDRFFRTSSSVEKSVPGIGLGLSIVKAIVEGHKGHVRIGAREGEGTAFYIELPLDDPSH